MKLKNQTEAFLLAEATQAWTHYRHLEETRTKYLAFFATVVLTSGGFLVTLLKDIDKFKPALLTGALALFCVLLFVFSFFIWANIVRIGFVLNAYGDIMVATRKYMLGVDSAGYRLWDIRTRIPPSVSRGAFTIQWTAGAIVRGVCLLLAMAEAGMGIAVTEGWIAAPAWLGQVVTGIAVALLAAVLYTSVRIRQAHKYQPPTPELSQLALYQGEHDIDLQKA